MKEIFALRSDVVMMSLLVYSFSLGLAMEATGTSTAVNNAGIAFVDEDRSSLSRALASVFLPPEFQAVVFINATMVDPAMDADRFLFVVGVPPNFEANLRARRGPELQLLIDATAMQQAGIGASYIQNLLADEVSRFARRHDLGAAPQIDLIIRSAFNPNRDTVQFQGVIALINTITTLTVILTGAALMREREHGTIEHLLVMPLSALDIAIAKIWANGLVVLLASTLAMVIVVEGLLQIEIAGSRLLFFLGTVLYLFTATALGIFLATIARSMAQFALLFILAIIPLQMLSGGDTPVENQPDSADLDPGPAHPTLHHLKPSDPLQRCDTRECLAQLRCRRPAWAAASDRQPAAIPTLHRNGSLGLFLTINEGSSQCMQRL
ncbi:MAG: ABC transporter permease [Pseudomonadota bacterium]